MLDSTIQSYLLYASLFAVGVYLCKETYHYCRGYLLQVAYDNSITFMESHFDTLALVFNKEKVQSIKTRLLKLNEDFLQNTIKYPEWKQSIKQIVDELFDLFDDYYR